MKIRFLFLTVLLSQVALGAEVELLNPESLQKESVDALRNLSKSPFQTLKKRFENGREPAQGDFTSWQPGRCYFADRPMQPVAGVLTHETTAADGPAFRGHQYRKIIPFVAKRSPPTYFDQMTPRTEALVQKLELKYQNDVAYPVRSNATIRSFIPRSMTIQARSYEIRFDGKFLILRLVCEDHGGCANAKQNRFLYLDGEDVAYCYYFRKGQTAKK